jgi:hypothetical protein
MPDRFCVNCNSKLVSINRSVRCRACREVAKKIKQRTEREKRMDDLKQTGMILVHSCLSDGRYDPASSSCECRKFVPIERAKDMIAKGRCLDMATRDACFRQGPIVETSRLKCPPISSLGQRIAIERKVVNHDFNERELLRIKATADEDRRLRIVEQDCKIEIENEIAIAERTKLTRVYSDEEWLEIEQIQKTLPVYVSGIGRDERSTVGRNARSSEVLIDDAKETERQSNDDSNGIKETELPDSNTNPTNVVSFESLECLQAEIEDTEEMAA